MLLPRYYFEKQFDQFEDMLQSTQPARLHLKPGEYLVQAGERVKNQPE